MTSLASLTKGFPPSYNVSSSQQGLYPRSGKFPDADAAAGRSMLEALLEPEHASRYVEVGGGEIYTQYMLSRSSLGVQRG